MNTHNNGNPSPDETSGSDRLPDETKLAYAYYKLYRDTPPETRSLRSLCEHEVNGKKRLISQLGRWSSEHNWQGRVAAYDAEVERAAYREQLTQRQAEVEAFIEEDMAISIKFQKLCKARLVELEKAGEKMDCKELRQLALTYKECREWLKNLIGIMQEEEDDDEEKET
ncbi:MAG: hypothetical protein OXU51_14545 [Candidatus Poribacteria bacterium]|nr:hypothetical protein [Candidatus Poribacteria bacterium]